MPLRPKRACLIKAQGAQCAAPHSTIKHLARASMARAQPQHSFGLDRVTAKLITHGGEQFVRERIRIARTQTFEQ